MHTPRLLRPVRLRRFTQLTRHGAIVSTLLLFMLSAMPVQAGGGVCATAEVAEAFVLPDGSQHPAGMLTLCHERAFNPVSSFNSAFVDRRPVALFTSHHDTVEPDAGSDYFLLFARAADERLRLVGYTLPRRSGAETRMLDRPQVTVKQILDQGVVERSNDSLIFLPATLD